MYLILLTPQCGLANGLCNDPDHRGIRIRSRNGKDQVIKDPAPRPFIPGKPPSAKAEPKQPAVDVARPLSPSKSARSVAAASNASKRTTNRVRIVGKNGEESFVELPFIPQSTKPASVMRSQKKVSPVAASSPKPAAASVPKPAEAAEEKKQRSEAAEKEAKRLLDDHMAAEEKRLRDEQAAADAKRLREERTAAEAKRAAESKAAAEGKKLEAERLAAEAMMHGALPASSKAAPSVKSAKGSKNSSKVSEKRYSAVFDPVSMPTSIASSTTSVSKARSAQQENAQLCGGLSQRTGAASAQSRPQTVGGWQEVGLGTYETAASSADRSQRSNRPASVAQNAGCPNWCGLASLKCSIGPAVPSHNSPISNPGILKSPQRSPPTAPSQLSNHSNHASQNRSQQRSRATLATIDSFPIAFPPLNHHSTSQHQPNNAFSPTREGGPTVFAGRGWISPHPLSEAPTWARSEPDPMIQLPRGASLRSVGAAKRASVETMTYEEWLRVQEEANSLASASKVHTVRSLSHAGCHRMNEGDVADEDRRNISRTSSHVSRHYGGGSWGYRGAGVGTEGSGNYRAPTVKTESERSSLQRQASVSNGRRSGVGAEQYVGEDGNVKAQLPMPWDRGAMGGEKASVSSAGGKLF